MILEHEIALCHYMSTPTIPLVELPIVISTLPDAIVCEITEERNGIYELYMEYPQEGHGADSIAPELVITAPTSEPRLASSSTVQPFIIYKVERSTSGVLNVYAEHISYQINRMVVPRVSGPAGGASLPVADALQELQEDTVCGQNRQSCPFTLTTDKTTSVYYRRSTPRSLRTALMGSEGSILDVYGGGEYIFDWFTIKLCSSRGADRGFSVEYGKNMSEAQLERDTSGLFTAVYPYWLAGESENAQGIVLPGDHCVFGPVATIGLSRDRIVPLDLSSEFETMPTETQLRDRATAYLNANGSTGIPRTITVKVVQGAEDEDVEIHSGYPPTITISSGQITNVETAFSARNNVVRLCDTVTVDCPPLGVSVKAKVVKTVWDAITERYKELEIGAVKSSLAGTIAGLENSVSAVEQQAGYSYLSVSGLNVSGNAAVGGALSLANNTWNTVGDDAQIGDVNAAGKIGIRGLNGPTGIRFVPPNVGNTYNVSHDLWIDGAGTMRVNGNFGITGGYYVNDKPYIKMKEFSFSASCGAGVTNTQTGDIEFSGYTPIGVIGYNVDGTSKISVSRIQAYDSNNQVSWKLVNQGSSAYSGTIWINILYMAT